MHGKQFRQVLGRMRMFETTPGCSPQAAWTIQTSCQCSTPSVAGQTHQQQHSDTSGWPCKLRDPTLATSPRPSDTSVAGRIMRGLFPHPGQLPSMSWWQRPSSGTPGRPADTRTITGAAESGAPARTGPQDVIQIRGARFYGYHGVLPAENAVGQPFIVDISLYCDLRAAGHTDDMAQTVSYADVFNCAKEVVEGPPHKLLESVAHAIARKILDAYERVESVRVAVNKTHIPNLSAAVLSVGVEVHRNRDDYAP